MACRFVYILCNTQAETIVIYFYFQIEIEKEIFDGIIYVHTILY